MKTSNAAFQSLSRWFRHVIAIGAIVVVAAGCSLAQEAGGDPGRFAGIYFRKSILTAPQPQFSLMAQLAVSPDQRLIAASNRGKGLLTVWDVQTSSVIMQTRVTSFGGGITFTADGRYLVADAATLPTIENRILASVLEPHTGKVVADLLLPPTMTVLPQDVNLRWFPERIVAHPAGGEVAIATCRDVVFYETRTWQPTLRWGTVAGDGCINVIAYGPNGTFVRATNKGFVQLFDSKAGKVTSQFKAHSVGVDAIAFTSEGHLLTGSNTTTGLYEGGKPLPQENDIVKLWRNTDNTKMAHVSMSSGVKVYGIAVSRDGGVVATARKKPDLIAIDGDDDTLSVIGSITIQKIATAVVAAANCFAFLEADAVELWCSVGGV